MSRKLATTIKDSAIPGKYKRIAEAYAAFASNDGTNSRASQKQLGDKAGVSPDTIQRNTPELLASTLLQRASSHTCKVTACNKGAWHFTGTWGRSVKVYEINIGNLQNAVSYLTAKCGLVNAAKCRKVKASKCGTTQVLEITQGQNLNSSALVPSDSERVSEGTDDSLRSPSTQCESQGEPFEDSGSLPEQQQDQNQNQTEIHWRTAEVATLWHKRTGKPFTRDEYALASALCYQHGRHVVEAVLDITLNHRPKSASMIWKRFQVFFDNWQTNYDLCLAWRQGTIAKDKRAYPRDIPTKYVIETISDANWKGIKDHFQHHNKVDAWRLTPDEAQAYVWETPHVMAVTRFCVDNGIRVTKEQFAGMMTECMATISPDTKSTAASAGGFNVEEAE